MHDESLHSDPLVMIEKEELFLQLALLEQKLAQVTQKLVERDQELAALHRMSEAIGSERHINRLCDKTVHEICLTFGATTVCVLLHDIHTGDLVAAASTSDAKVNGSHPRVKPGDGLLWQVMKTGKPLHLPGSAAAHHFAGMQGLQDGIAVPIRSKQRTLGMIYACGRAGGKGFSDRERDLLCGIANQTGFALDNATLYHDLENLFVGIAWSFASALDAKSPWTAGHSKRVTQYAVAIAEELDKGSEFLNAVQTCGLLHDIGKIAIPEKLLDKQGAITYNERRTIAEHAVRGAKILEHIDTFQPFLPGIRHHHERWDGEGLPDGLAGEEIPLLARVLAVADSYDAMTSDRPYRQRRTRAEAIEEIERCSGTQFDPQVVEAFIEVASHRIF
jgi:putative nucleotidyltransferase with HDIG domain